MKKKTPISDCKDLKINLKNQKNSCYLDSVLVSLFHDGNASVLRNLILKSKIRNHGEEINNIAKDLLTFFLKNDVLKLEYCIDVRRLLQNYQDIYHNKIEKIEKIDWLNNQAEPFDLIRMINLIFDVPNTTYIHREVYGVPQNKNKEVLVSKDEIKNNFVEIIGADILYGGKDVHISSLYPVQENVSDFSGNVWKNNGVSYKKRIERNTYKKCDLLFLHINRLSYLGKSKTNVIPTEYIKIGDKNLYLRSILLHHGEGNGGHYTCLYMCNGEWYEYDDIRAGVKKLIGSLKDVVMFNKGYCLKNSTDLVYY